MSKAERIVVTVVIATLLLATAVLVGVADALYASGVAVVP